MAVPEIVTQEDWELPAGRNDHVRGNQPDFSS